MKLVSQNDSAINESAPSLRGRAGGEAVLFVLGADLMDGTPIYDIKPYIPYADAHPDARRGFVDQHAWHPLKVEVPADVAILFTAEELRALREVLAQDPRPRYHDDADRIYGMPFAGRDVKFCVDNGVVQVVAAE